MADLARRVTATRPVGAALPNPNVPRAAAAAAGGEARETLASDDPGSLFRLLLPLPTVDRAPVAFAPAPGEVCATRDIVAGAPEGPRERTMGKQSEAAAVDGTA